MKDGLVGAAYMLIATTLIHLPILSVINGVDLEISIPDRASFFLVFGCKIFIRKAF